MRRTGPLRKPSFREHIGEVNRAMRGQEAMFGDLREAKGMPVPETIQLAEKRGYTKHVRAPDELSELQEQIRVIAWWDKNSLAFGLPQFALFSIPNGSSLTSIIYAANLKRSGLRSGIEDLFLAVPRDGWHGLFIEMKAHDGKLSPEQVTISAHHKSLLYGSFAAFSHEQAIEAIKSYLHKT